MCGIVAYVGRKTAQPLLIEGLKRLEYRGYDSAGIAVIDERRRAARPPGRRADQRAGGQPRDGSNRRHPAPLPPARLGMAHTRWATHGAPTEVNAHPHTDDAGRIALVHNGIIENYVALKQFLTEKGHVFTSQTDTEVLAVLIGDLYAELKRRNHLAAGLVAAAARGAGGAARGGGDVRHRGDLQGRAGHAGRGPQGQPADHRRRARTSTSSPPTPARSSSTPRR